MTEDLIEGMGRLHDELDRTLTRWQGSQTGLPAVTGHDESDSVTVRLAADGSVRSIGLTSTWVEHCEPESLGDAVLAAYHDASRQRLEAFAARMRDSEQGPAPTLRPAPLPSASLTAGLLEVSTGAGQDTVEQLGRLLHDVNRQLDHVFEAIHEVKSRSFTGTGAAHQATVTVDAGGVPIGVQAPTLWLRRTHATNIARELTEALLAASREAALAAPTALLASGPVGELNRLAADPIALAERLGLR